MSTLWSRVQPSGVRKTQEMDFTQEAGEPRTGETAPVIYDFCESWAQERGEGQGKGRAGNRPRSIFSPER